MPSSSSSAFSSQAALTASANPVPGCGSRSSRSSSACSWSSARLGQTWKPRQARLTAHATCARSAATSARDGVPLTVCTVVVSSQSGALSGTRFWKKFCLPTPFGKRCISTGRPRIARINGSSTAA